MLFGQKAPPNLQKKLGEKATEKPPFFARKPIFTPKNTNQKGRVLL